MNRGLHFFQKERMSGLRQKRTGLINIGSSTQIECECFKATQGGSHALHDVMGCEKNSPTVNASGKTDANRLFGWQTGNPFLNFLSQSPDISGSNGIQIIGLRVFLRVKIAGVNRVWVWAANQQDFHDIMGWNHPGVAGVKLISQAFLLKPF